MLTFRDETSFTFAPPGSNLIYGPAHGDDLYFLFYFDENHDTSSWSQANIDTSRKMCRMWANFAREMNPTPDDQLGVEWKVVDKNDHKYLNIGQELVMEMSEEYMR